ncbi:predicted protein [Plenodomus lingam JN3]|uniref:Predicted protein n=1 Tax=Leptosphaeria maculans (strain JN3 / isolate v23.1.3 / race Av1-4-5-6-7-8) TaxID=985895 RepID=E4ZLJ9_LEPMJ|nr:predicted protein [Plenodomus lingam JN3]CBX92679.1 predicted protein [Plenodomus lingam JN3]
MGHGPESSKVAIKMEARMGGNIKIRVGNGAATMLYTISRSARAVYEVKNGEESQQLHRRRRYRDFSRWIQEKTSCRCHLVAMANCEKLWWLSELSHLQSIEAFSGPELEERLEHKAISSIASLTNDTGTGMPQLFTVRSAQRQQLTELSDIGDSRAPSRQCTTSLDQAIDSFRPLYTSMRTLVASHEATATPTQAPNAHTILRRTVPSPLTHHAISTDRTLAPAPSNRLTNTLTLRVKARSTLLDTHHPSPSSSKPQQHHLTADPALTNTPNTQLQPRSLHANHPIPSKAASTTSIYPSDTTLSFFWLNLDTHNYEHNHAKPTVVLLRHSHSTKAHSTTRASDSGTGTAGFCYEMGRSRWDNGGRSWGCVGRTMGDMWLCFIVGSLVMFETKNYT